MHLEEQDITIIKQLLEDYQEYCGRDPWDGLYVMVSASHPAAQDWLARSKLYGRLTRDTPMVLKAFSDKMPPGFCLLHTLNNEWYASHTSFYSDGLEVPGSHGPTTEFQARLWCWQESLMEKDIDESEKL